MVRTRNRIMLSLGAAAAAGMLFVGLGDAYAGKMPQQSRQELIAVHAPKQQTLRDAGGVFLPELRTGSPHFHRGTPKVETPLGGVSSPNLARSNNLIRPSGQNRFVPPGYAAPNQGYDKAWDRMTHERLATRIFVPFDYTQVKASSTAKK